MKSYLDNMLIPAGKRFDIEKAVTKAIELAGTQGTTIHLVHIIRSYSFFGTLKAALGRKTFSGNDLDVYLRALVDLMHWKNFIERKAPATKVKIHIKRGFSLHPLITQVAKKEKVGMVISAGNLKYKWFLGEGNISVIEHGVESNSDIAITLFKPLPGKSKQGNINNFNAKGIQGRLSYN